MLEPGARLMIGELQERYGLGAMPLREALNRLSAEQLVQKSEQRGFWVPPLNFEDFLEIQTARIVIEAACLRETIERMSPEWEERMVVALHHLVRAGEAGEGFILTDRWAVSHRGFHQTLISGCRNGRLLAYAENLYQQSARYRMRTRRLSSLRSPTRPQLVEEHKAILDAALEGDAELAVARLIEHYRLSVEIVLARPVLVSGDRQRFIVVDGGERPSW